MTKQLPRVLDGSQRIVHRKPPSMRDEDLHGSSFAACKNCGGRETRVIDSRTKQLGRYRMRICAKCHYRQATYEIPKELFNALVGVARKVGQVSDTLTELSAYLNNVDLDED